MIKTIKQFLLNRGLKIKIKPIYLYLALLVAFVVVSLSYNFYLHRQLQTTKKQLANSASVSAPDEVASLLKELSQLIDLPENEQPTVATVVNKQELTDQPFFAKAENGDRVIIYTKAQKAILYRPNIHKIIEVAPITISSKKK